jgi:hypothetical protein
MANKKKDKKQSVIKNLIPKVKIEDKPKVLVAKKAVKLPANPRKITEPMLPFERWFNSKKAFKPHWKAGMQKYTDTSVRRTYKQWEEIFKNY